MNTTTITEAKPDAALQRALDAIQARGREYGERDEADKANEVTVSVTLGNMDVTCTGIAPFAAVEMASWIAEGVTGWKVLGQRYTRDNLAHTCCKVWVNGQERWGGLPLLSKSEAVRLAIELNAAASVAERRAA